MALRVFNDDVEIMQFHDMLVEGIVLVEVNDVEGIMRLHELFVDGTARVEVNDDVELSHIHISEPTRLGMISSSVYCLSN